IVVAILFRELPGLLLQAEVEEDLSFAPGMLREELRRDPGAGPTAVSTARHAGDVLAEHREPHRERRERSTARRRRYFGVEDASELCDELRRALAIRRR